MSTSLKVAISVAVVFTVAFTSFAGGILATRVFPALQSATPMDELATPGERVDEVADLLRAQALKVPTETSLTAGAIEGLLEGTGDDYALYFDATHFNYLNEMNEGVFGGIGVTIGEREGSAYVIEVLPDTPAERAGIKTDDVFVSIDGVSREKWDTQEVVKRVRGKEGTVVAIKMRRASEKDLVEFKLTRAKITMPIIESKMIGDDVGYVRLDSFNLKSTDEVRNAIEELEGEGAKGLILDLRDDPGGLLRQAIEVSSLFIEEGAIVRVDERGKPEVEHRATGGVATKKPLVLLVNENSASASEIVAGALQDYDRAVVVGQKTFGKGSVQTIEELSFGGAVKFTIAHYLTPKRRVINGKGVTPDIVVKMDPEKQASEATDTQLKRALVEIRKLTR